MLAPLVCAMRQIKRGLQSPLGCLPKWFRGMSFGTSVKGLRNGIAGYLPDVSRNDMARRSRNHSEIMSACHGGSRSGSASIPCRNPSETSPRPYRDTNSGNVPNPLPKQGPERGIVGSFLPHSFMAKFLTVKEAANVIGKSASSIRRIIYPILEDDQHPDRHHIEPDVETAKALRVKGENFPWKISEELLDRVSSEAGPKAKAEPRTNATGDDQSEVIIDILRKQLDIKDTGCSGKFSSPLCWLLPSPSPATNRRPAIDTVCQESHARGLPTCRCWRQLSAA